jgi:hypothetical protein
VLVGLIVRAQLCGQRETSVESATVQMETRRLDGTGSLANRFEAAESDCPVTVTSPTGFAGALVGVGVAIAAAAQSRPGMLNSRAKLTAGLEHGSPQPANSAVISAHVVGALAPHLGCPFMSVMHAASSRRPFTILSGNSDRWHWACKQ